ncbi:MAG TPA: response regulator [Candidatus Saccharimonadales bacterium]|jgi:DNA-binding response OmpR family regulator|nr:response regulator [Candidatus Saccharimonadales bacterium]
MEPQPTEPTASGAGRKVLVVEDEHFISELYVRALTRAGYDVTVEFDGQRGEDQAKTDQFDIILLDIMVPTITGLEVLRHLRSPGAKPLKAKIIITTNLEQREETRADIESKADAYLVKAEITPRELVAFLDTIK